MKNTGSGKSAYAAIAVDRTARPAGDASHRARGTAGGIAARDVELELARRVNRARNALGECLRTLVRATDEQELCDAICRVVVDVAGYSLAWIGLAEDDERKTVRQLSRRGEAASYPDEIPVTGGDDALGLGPAGTAIRTGRVRRAGELVIEPSYEPWRVAAARHGLESSVSLPLLKDDVAFGALIVHAPEPDAFGETETGILIELARDLAFGIRMLRERSERDRLIAGIEQVAESIIITDREARITYVNPAFERVTGYTRNEVFGRNPSLLKSGLQPASFYEAMWAALAMGSPWMGDLVNRRKDGALFTEEAVISPVRDSSGAVASFVSVQRDVTRERQSADRFTKLVRERALISETIRGLRAGDTPEVTAQAICRQVASFPSIAAAHLSLFGLDGRAHSIGLVIPGRPDPPMRRVGLQRSRQLQLRAAEGPWIESWSARPSRSYGEVVKGLGIQAVTYAPVRHDGLLIGFLGGYASQPSEDVAVTEVLPALVEFADLAGALIGRDVAARTEAGRSREHVAGIIASRAFRPVFQPIVGLRHGETVGYEALTSFDNGADPESTFALAAAISLGVDLEVATLRAALAEAETLPRKAWLNLNASPELVLGGESLRDILRGSRRRLVLEVTEHAAIADYPGFRAAMVSFGPRVEFAVDDTGTGYANLRHIVELHPAFVKLDRSLIASLDSDDARQAMIVGLCHFANATGCRLIVEGIETDRELDVLRSLAVELGQGYLLGRPVPVAEARRPNPALRTAD